MVKRLEIIKKLFKEYQSPNRGRLRIAWKSWLCLIALFWLYIIFVDIPLPINRGMQVSMIESGPESVKVQHLFGYPEYTQRKVEKKTMGKPNLYLVLTNLGLNKTVLDKVLTHYPKATTLGFWPYTQNLKQIMADAWKNGHELLLALPLQPQNGLDLGPLMIQAQDTPEQRLKNLTEILQSGENYLGVIATGRNQIIHTHELISPLLKTLEEKKLTFIDASLSARSFVPKLLERSHEPLLTVNFLIESEVNISILNQELDQLRQNLAKNQDQVIVVEATPANIKIVLSWLQHNQNLFDIQPISGAFTRAST